MPLKVVILFFFIRYSIPFEFSSLPYLFVFAHSQSELDAGSFDTEVSSMLHLFIDVCRHEHLLGGNAAAQGAGTAEAFVFLNNRAF